jgi:hypothetical protein
MPQKAGGRVISARSMFGSHLQKACWLLLLAWNGSAHALGRLPSVYHHAFVSTANQLDPAATRLDYNVFVVFPVLCFGPSITESYRRLGIAESEREHLDHESGYLRYSAHEAILSNLEAQGFPRDSIPEGMKKEYEAIRHNSIVVMVMGPHLSTKTPIFGVASVSLDWVGEGTAGEERLGPLVPRSDQLRIGFMDFNIRDGVGPIKVREDLSLLMSSRLWIGGGVKNVAEVKTLELTLQAQELEAQALRMGVAPSDVRGHSLEIIQHVISSYVLVGRDQFPDYVQRFAAPEDLLEKRLHELRNRIDRAADGSADRRRELEESMRRFARNPPPQEFSIIDDVFVYVGGLDPKTGRDLNIPKERVFRTRYPFPEKIKGFQDPEVAQMNLSVLRGPRPVFDSGEVFRHHVQKPGQLVYHQGFRGVNPPTVSTTYRCSEYLVLNQR